MLLPVNYLLSDVHLIIVHPESELNQLKSGFEPQKEVVAERAVTVVVEATAKAEDAQKRSAVESAGNVVVAEATAKAEDAQKRSVAETARDVVGAAAKDQKQSESKPVLKASHILLVNYLLSDVCRMYMP